MTIIRTYSKKQLCDMYGVKSAMLYKWLVTVGEVFTHEDWCSRDLFTPLEVEKIFKHLGEPEKPFSE